MTATPVHSRSLLNRWLVPLFALMAFAVPLAVFFPAIRNNFVNWDDRAYFLENLNLGDLSGHTIHWAFTTTYLGHFQPLNWLSYALDVHLAGLDPRQFHLTSILLHAVVALAVFQLARLIIARINCDSHPFQIAAAALAASLLFSLHPLRVESVAWASARADLLAALFCTISAIAYIRAFPSQAPSRSGPRTAPYLLAILLFFMALLSKEVSVTFPAILILLDIYPLRRFDPRFGPASPNSGSISLSRLLLEKTPFILPAVILAAFSFTAAGPAVADLTAHPIAARLAQVPVSFTFYLKKTLLPFHLSPLYEFPASFGWSLPLVWYSAAVTTLIILVIWKFRLRFPALPVAALAYTILIFPVLGLTQRGPQMVADRYAYLACLPWALLVGTLFLHLLRTRPALAAALIFISASALASLTRNQIKFWHDSVALWQHAADLDPTNAAAWAGLGEALATENDLPAAIEAYQRALRIQPDHPDVHRNLAGAFNRLGRQRDALEHYEADLKQNPNRKESRYFAGIALEQLGEYRRAAEHFRAAVDIDPDFVDAHVSLARVFIQHGFLAEAEPRLRRALEIAPEHVEARCLLAAVCARTNRIDEARDLLDAAAEYARRLHRFDLEAPIKKQLESLPAGPNSTTTSAPAAFTPDSRIKPRS